MDNKEGFLWFHLEKSFLCGAYIPPNNTSPTITTKMDYLRKLNEMLLKYKDKRDILIMGDLNAGTGNETTILKTGNCGVKVNTSGRKLISICSRHSLEIANGQTPEDRLGNFTFQQ